MDYISLHSDEFAVAFCQATASLCPDVQRLIWQEVISPPKLKTPPPAPKKSYITLGTCPVYYRTCSATLPRNLFGK